MMDLDSLKLSEDELQELPYEELQNLYEKVMQQYEQALAVGDVRTADELKEYGDELEELVSRFEE